jgi:hypothetical protein
MTKIPTLYDKLKPRVRAKLKENEGKYSSIVRQVIVKLESTYFVQDLTVGELKRIHLFSDTDYVNQTALSIMWGDEIFDDYDGSN